MVSITSDPNGRRRIQFIDGQSKRHAIRLGKMSHRQALAFKVKLEDLVGARNSRHTPSIETQSWLIEMDDALHAKLCNVGLATPRGAATIGGFTRAYIDGRADIRPRSRINMDQARTYLLEFFSEDKLMRDITEGDAEDFQQHMVRSGRADNTIRRAVGRIRQFFKAAKRRELVQTEPFAILPASVRAVPERLFFVKREVIAKVLEHCPDDQWRLIILLARYGGLRCPSELLTLKWSDINWEENKIRVPSPKTQRHEGGASRMIPMFPELRPDLLAAFASAEEGSEYVITRYRDSSANLRTHFHRIIQRAGYKPWPKLFQNLRSTRETELAETYPMQVVTAWMGNSELVAAKHYLQVTEDHFKSASGDQVETTQPTSSTNQAAHNAAQKLHETAGNDWNDKIDESDEMLAMGAISSSCENLQDYSKSLIDKAIPRWRPCVGWAKNSVKVPVAQADGIRQRLTLDAVGLMEVVGWT